ncbi:MAG: diaminopimelate decarboxylase [Bdellovibrionales bacterium]
MAFQRQDSEWVVKQGEGSQSLRQIFEQCRRPMYFYDLNEALKRAQWLSASSAKVHFAMKSNADARLLRSLAALGLGADVVSLGEIQRAMRHGFPADRIIFSGVAKGREEIEFALRHRLFQINVESFEELQVIDQVARESGLVADLALRMNIHVQAPTHKNIQTATERSKFGLDIRKLPDVLAWMKNRSHLRLRGLATHVGSQILDVQMFGLVARRMGEVWREVKNQHVTLDRLDLGGGLGIDYREEGAQDESLAKSYLKELTANHGTGAQVLIEPGRFLVARMGVLLGQIRHVKQGLDRKFIILDVGMNALMRPALYEAYHRMEILTPAKGDTRATEVFDVVGPICESTDVLAEDRSFPTPKAGEVLAIFDVGAYGAVMANDYNELPRPMIVTCLDGRIETA